MFGEPIPKDALDSCVDQTWKCDLMLLIGTSAVVFPAAQFPLDVRRLGGKLIEINPNETPLTALAEVVVRAPSGEALPRIVSRLREVAPAMTDALAGIRVLDLTIWQQGPMTAAMLADWGADVIKIEGPDSPDPGRSLPRYEAAPGGVNAYFETHNRNKRGIVLDLKSEAGLEAFYRLVRDADVFIQNFRPGVAERLKIDYETLREMNPRLVYCQASGFGLNGPDAERPALDPLAQARGGLMTVTGEPDQPPTRTFTGFADQVSAFVLAYGIMVALFHRERTGEGQKVDGSLLQSVIGAQAFNITSYMMSGIYAGSPIPRIPRGMTVPIWNHYRCEGRPLADAGDVAARPALADRSRR